MKFVLDTNVVSEITSLRPAVSVMNWIGAQAKEDLFTTSVTVHEVRYGISLMPIGRRRQVLEADLEKLLSGYFNGKVMVLDSDAARVSGEVAARGKLTGSQIGLGDCMIAGIAIANNASVVTRNVKHFATTGATIVNPWGK